MPWKQLSATVPHSALTATEQTFLECGAVAVSFRDAADSPILEPLPGQFKPWPNTIVTGLFAMDADPRSVSAALRVVLGPATDFDFAVELLEDQAWERAWMAHAHPMRFGSRLWVYPNRELPRQVRNDSVNIALDPGLAFGTGSHATTALCLEWLDAHPPEASLVVDYGCGSGILAIAAAKLGAREVWAVDIDSQALLASKANAIGNGISQDRLRAVSPQLLPPLKADLVIANIISGTLISLAKRLAELSRPDGQLLLSGLLPEQGAAVVKGYCEWFDFSAPVAKDGWLLLCGRNKATL